MSAALALDLTTHRPSTQVILQTGNRLDISDVSSRFQNKFEMCSLLRACKITCGLGRCAVASGASAALIRPCFPLASLSHHSVIIQSSLSHHSVIIQSSLTE